MIIALAGSSPGAAWQALLAGALGSRNGWGETGAKTIPLILSGLSVAVCFRVGFFNIGAEGQFLMGALLATALGTRGALPWPLVLAGGALAGAFWSLLAGWLKVRRQAPEIISTIMLNYVALRLVEFAVQGPLQEKARSQPQSDVLVAAAQIPLLLSGTTLHWGLLPALLGAVLCWWLLFHTERGLLWRASGANPEAAQAAGVLVSRHTLQGVALGGGLAGLGGAMEIAGSTHMLSLGSFGYGYTAIAVALLGNLHPLGLLPAAFIFGVLDAGDGAMERSAGVPAVTVSIVIGIAILAIALLPRLQRSSTA